MNAPAVLAYDEDVVNRSLIDWIKIHTIAALPLHRYKGTLYLKSTHLEFEGIDNKKKLDVHLIIPKHEVAGIYYGFDTVYSGFETRNMGLLWKPLRLKIKSGIEENYLYMVINYKYGVCDNDKWCVVLEKWIAEK